MHKIRTIIDSNRSVFPKIKELIEYKDLFFVLAYRDFKVRYAQAFLGFLWALIQPLVSMVILIIVFGKFAGIKTTIPYPLFIACGMTVWTYFSYVLSQAGGSLIASQQMIKKIYFPRLIIPLSKALVGFIDFSISLAILIGLVIYYGQNISVNILFLPLFFLLAVVASLSVGIWLSALTIRYRDFIFILPFMIQVGLYITPIAYPAEIVLATLPHWAATLFFLNPIAGIVEGFRWSIFGIGEFQSIYMLSYMMVLILFLSSLVYFKKMEYLVADLV